MNRIETTKLIALAFVGLLFTQTEAIATEPSLTSSAPNVVINKHFGFNVKGYKYKQSELPCDLDEVLVADMIEDGIEHNIRLSSSTNPNEIRHTKSPVLAIDVEGLALGSKEYTYGSRTSSTLPSVQVTAALISGKNKENIVTAKHSCAIMTIQDLNPTASNIMDMGTYGVTVCKATHKCLGDLSKNIVSWVAPHVGQ